VRRGMVNIDVMKSLPRGALNRLLTPRPEIRRVSKQAESKKEPKPGEGIINGREAAFGSPLASEQAHL
jgi:hypothetical protein